MTYKSRGTTCVKFAILKEASSESHCLREKELDYLLPVEHQLENWHWMECSIKEKRDEISERYRQYTATAQKQAFEEKWKKNNPTLPVPEKEYRGQKMQTKSRIFREGVIVYDEHTTFHEIKNCCKDLGERFGFKVFQIHCHNDEGSIDSETGEVKYNRHAHIICDWTDQQTGINLEGVRIAKTTDENREKKKERRAKFLKRQGTDEETVAAQKEKKKPKEKVALVFEANKPGDQVYFEMAKKYDIFKVGLFEEDFSAMQDVAAQSLKMNRGQYNSQKGVDISEYKAKRAIEKAEKMERELEITEHRAEIVADSMNVMHKANQSLEEDNKRLRKENIFLEAQRECYERELEDIKQIQKLTIDIPEEFRDGEDNKVFLRLWERVRLWGGRLVHRANIAIRGGLKPIGGVYLAFNRETKNINVHQDIQKVRTESQLPDIKQRKSIREPQQQTQAPAPKQSPKIKMH